MTERKAGFLMMIAGTAGYLVVAYFSESKVLRLIGCVAAALDIGGMLLAWGKIKRNEGLT